MINETNRTGEIALLASLFLNDEDEDTIKAVVQTFRDNGLDDPESLVAYSSYSIRNKGCNPDNPVVINDTGMYVHLEYCIVRILDFLNTEDDRSMRRKRQSLESRGGRHIDHLCFTVSYLGDKPDTYEDYYFDITTGFDALYNQKY